MSWRDLILQKDTFGVCPHCKKETSDTVTKGGVTYYSHDRLFGFCV